MYLEQPMKNEEEIVGSLAEILDYESDCLSRDFLESVLMRVYIREISIERGVEMILSDIEYMKRNLLKD
jgi:hypothetical protein